MPANRPLAFLVGLLLAVVAWTWALPETTSAFTPQLPLTGIYVRQGPEGGPRLDFAPPASGEATRFVAYQPRPSAPGCLRVASTQQDCRPTVLGNVTLGAATSLATSSLLNVWLSTDAPAPWPLRSLSFDLERIRPNGATSVLAAYRLESGNANSTTLPLTAREPRPGDVAGPGDVTLTDTPRKVALGAARFAATSLDAGDRIQLSVKELGGPVQVNDTVRVFVHASPQTPTGVVLPLRSAESAHATLGTAALGFFLAPQRLDFEQPTDPTAEALAVTTNADPLQPTEILWGSTVMDETTRAVEDGILVVDVVQRPGSNPGAAPRLALQARLRVNGTDHHGTSSIALGAAPSTSDTTPVRFVVGLPLRGIEFPLGTTVSLGLRFHASTHTSGYEILYGSAARPSGVLVPVEGGGLVLPAPPPEPTVPEPEPEPEPSPEPSPEPTPSAEPSPEPTQEPSPEPENGTPPATSQPPATQEPDPSPLEQPRETPGLMVMGVLAALATAACLRRDPGKPFK